MRFSHPWWLAGGLLGVLIGVALILGAWLLTRSVRRFGDEPRVLALLTDRPAGRRTLKGVLLVLGRRDRVRRARAASIRSRHATHPRDEPRRHHRARLLEEHVRARRHSVAHGARQDRGRPVDRGSPRCTVRRSGVRGGTPELPADERRRSDCAILPADDAVGHAGGWNGDRARSRAWPRFAPARSGLDRATVA